MIIVRSCIPGNEARDMCFSLSNVICSYTCGNINKVEDKIFRYYRNSKFNLSCLSALSAKKACHCLLKARKEWRLKFVKKYYLI